MATTSTRPTCTTGRQLQSLCVVPLQSTRAKHSPSSLLLRASARWVLGCKAMNGVYTWWLNCTLIANELAHSLPSNYVTSITNTNTGDPHAGLEREDPQVHTRWQKHRHHCWRARPPACSSHSHQQQAAGVCLFVFVCCILCARLCMELVSVLKAKGCMNQHTHNHTRSSFTQAVLAPGPMGRAEHTNEELVSVLKAKGCTLRCVGT